MRSHPVVRLEDGKVGAAGLLEATVDRGTIALVFLVDDADARVSGLVGAHDLERAIGRSVVEDDDLEVDAVVLLG